MYLAERPAAGVPSRCLAGRQAAPETPTEVDAIPATAPWAV
jgi:hypothetical protein